jgi:hypothetical protein
VRRRDVLRAGQVRAPVRAGVGEVELRRVSAGGPRQQPGCGDQDGADDSRGERPGPSWPPQQAAGRDQRRHHGDAEDRQQLLEQPQQPVAVGDLWHGDGGSEQQHAGQGPFRQGPGGTPAWPQPEQDAAGDRAGLEEDHDGPADALVQGARIEAGVGEQLAGGGAGQLVGGQHDRCGGARNRAGAHGRPVGGDVVEVRPQRVGVVGRRVPAQPVTAGPGSDLRAGERGAGRGTQVGGERDGAAGERRPAQHESGHG